MLSGFLEFHTVSSLKMWFIYTPDLLLCPASIQYWLKKIQIIKTQGWFVTSLTIYETNYCLLFINKVLLKGLVNEDFFAWTEFVKLNQIGKGWFFKLLFLDELIKYYFEILKK